MKKLTQRQKEVLDTLKALIADKGYPPTVKELGKALGISDKATHDYLNVLKKKKKITWKSNEGRRSPRTSKYCQTCFVRNKTSPKQVSKKTITFTVSTVKFKQSRGSFHEKTEKETAL